jgi:2-dehydropantoate 2-reductase
MKFVVIGAGAIGGVTAAYMAVSGIDVTLVCRRAQTADVIRTAGLRITGAHGEHRIKMKAVAEISELEGMYDYCLIATKAYDLEAAAKEILPFLAPGGLVVSLQNGICFDVLARTVGTSRAVGAVITWSSTYIGDAHLELTGEGGFIIGYPGGRGPSGKPEGPDESLEQLREAMNNAFPTKISEDIFSEIFSKLIINSGITCGGAMTGQTLGQMLAGRPARLFFMEIVREDMAVARAMGLKVPPFGGRLDYDKFTRGSHLLAQLRRHAILLAVGLRYRKLKSSSLTALERGGKTEVDYLNGWIAGKARELGIDAPVNTRVVDIIKEIEAGKRAIAPGNLIEALEGMKHGQHI